MNFALPGLEAFDYYQRLSELKYVHAPTLSTEVDGRDLLNAGKVVYEDGVPVINFLPTFKELDNFVPTLRIIHDAALALRPDLVVVTSGYRSPEYNRAVGGTATSLHLRCNAIDHYFVGTPHDELADFYEAHEQADLCGIGRYNGFTHLDTRGTLGRQAPARWDRRTSVTS